MIFDILHFSDYWNQCFFYAVANEINRVKNAIQNVVEWKYTVAENGNPQALVPFKIPWTLALSSIQPMISTVSCVAIASEDASSAKVVAQCTPKSRGKKIYFWVPAWYLFLVQMLRTVQTQRRKEEVLLVLEEEGVEVLWSPEDTNIIIRIPSNK